MLNVRSCSAKEKMSGRSAWVRAKTAERADKQSSSSQYPEYGFDSFIYGLDGLPAVQNAMQTSQSYVGMQSPPLGRRHSLSSAKNIYAYPSPPARKPRPIIIASAIEKSDFRIHFDGMSKSVRGKIGKLIKRGSENPEPRIRQPTGSGSSESGSRSTVFASSLTIVPSPTPATPPLDGLGTFLYSPSVSSQQSHRARPYEGSTQGIRRFEGGGKLPKLEWRSMANVCHMFTPWTLLLANNYDTESRVVGFKWRYTYIHVHTRFEDETASFIPR